MKLPARDSDAFFDSTNFTIARRHSCNYGKSIMKTIELQLARIGNSRGIRLPADWIRRHALESGMILEDRGSEIVLRPKGGLTKLSWKETARETAAANEDWSSWEHTMADGLDAIPWENPSINKP